MEVEDGRDVESLHHGLSLHDVAVVVRLLLLSRLRDDVGHRDQVELHVRSSSVSNLLMVKKILLVESDRFFWVVEMKFKHLGETLGPLCLYH